MKHLGYMIACFITLLNANLVKAQDDVKIGTQVWTSKNLDVSTFRNGEVIPEVKSKEQWAKAGENRQPAYCYYNFDSKNGKVYGKLYNWYAVNDSRGLAPKGYHIPTDAEWSVLTDFLGGEYIAGTGTNMKSTTGWSNSGSGNNSSGFNGLQGSSCDNDGDFKYTTGTGSWWSSSEWRTNTAHSRVLFYNESKVYRSDNDKKDGLSVRCLRD